MSSQSRNRAWKRIQMAVLSLYHSARTPLTHCRISYQSLLPDPVDLAVFDRAARDQSIEIHSTENGFFTLIATQMPPSLSREQLFWIQNICWIIKPCLREICFRKGVPLPRRGLSSLSK